MSPNQPVKMSGKIYDPLFLCMLGAVVLAIGSSVVLRVMVGGPQGARAAEVVPAGR